MVLKSLHLSPCKCYLENIDRRAQKQTQITHEINLQPQSYKRCYCFPIQSRDEKKRARVQHLIVTLTSLRETFVPTFLYSKFQRIPFLLLSQFLFLSTLENTQLFTELLLRSKTYSRQLENVQNNNIPVMLTTLSF